MTDTEINRLINHLETKYPVNEWSIMSRHIWPLIKMQIVTSCYRSGDFSGTVQKTKQNRELQKIHKYLRALKIKKIRSAKNCDILIFHHNISRSVLLDDGTRFDNVLDPFTLLLEDTHNIVSLDYLESSNYLNSFRKTNIIDDVFNRKMFFAIIRSRRKIDKQLEKYDLFVKDLPEALQIELQIDNIEKLVCYMNGLCSFYKKILKKKGVKLAITGAGYGMDTGALFMACKELGIKCMEVQHGIAGGSGHSWYYSWKKMPLREARYEMLPDIYWCWTNRDAKVIDSWGKGRHIAYVGGKPILSVLGYVKKMTCGKEIITTNDNPIVLFTLQPGVRYPEWIVNVIKKTSYKYNWVIRKHPRYDTSQDQLIQKVLHINNVYFENIESIMLEKILLKANVHITNHSSVVVDAIVFGVKSIILGIDHIEMFQKEIEEGLCYPGDSEETTIELIETICGSDKTGNEHLENYYMKNMIFLNSILGT